jgi:uncharacterized protein YozE (UPF0346 family)
MKVYGSVNNHTKKLISQLADRIAESTGVPKSRQFHNEISFIIVKTIVNHSTPKMTKPKATHDRTEDPETLFNQQTFSKKFNLEELVFLPHYITLMNHTQL